MTDAHTSRAHARLAPSAAYRWMECPGSIRMSQGIESKSSTYAAEGTAAHELAAFCLSNDLDASGFLYDVIDIEHTEERPFTTAAMDNVRYFAVDVEMVEGVQVYLDVVRSLLPKKGVRGEDYELDIEQRLDMRHVHPEIYGTGDAVVYQAKAGRLHVIDFKYGRGVVVEPDENPQLLLYGIGAARRYHNRVLNEVVLHVVQPRAPHAYGPVRAWQTDPLTLMEFEDVLRERGLLTEADDAPTVAGDWCRFCPALPVCPTAAEAALAVAKAEFDEGQPLPPPETLSGKRLAEVLKAAEHIGNWTKAVQEYAHTEAVAGRTPPGYKLVQKRAFRKWKVVEVDDIPEALAYFHNVPPDEIFNPPELRSPAQIEKVVGKRAFQAIEAALVRRVSSGTILVPEVDMRPAVISGPASEFEEV